MLIKPLSYIRGPLRSASHPINGDHWALAKAISHIRGPLQANHGLIPLMETFAVYQPSYKWGPLAAGQGNTPHPGTLTGRSRKAIRRPVVRGSHRARREGAYTGSQSSYRPTARSLRFPYLGTIRLNGTILLIKTVACEIPTKGDLQQLNSPCKGTWNPTNRDLTLYFHP